MTVLTGPNGIGKTTALQAILGLTLPTTGRVTVAGVDDLRAGPAGWWRQVAWLAQRPVLIPGTMRRTSSCSARCPISTAACAASGFDEVLAEAARRAADGDRPRRVGLSLGQRQRLGLARVLGSRRPCCCSTNPPRTWMPRPRTRVLAAIAARAARRCDGDGRRAPCAGAGDRRPHHRGRLA